MSEYPIEGLMKTTMESLNNMVDVNKIVGDPVETPDGSVIIPISKVCFGYAAGGGEYKVKNSTQENQSSDKPFAGGSGAGVSVRPVAFLVVGQGQIKLLPVDANITVDKIIDLIPQLFGSLQNAFKGKECKKQDKPDQTLNENTESPQQ